MSDNPNEYLLSGSEDLKEEEPPNFFYQLGTDIGIFIGYSFIGVFILYGCKVAAAKIIPTDADCRPYVSIEEAGFPCPLIPQPNPIVTNINIIQKNGELASTKLEFDYEKNIKMLENGIFGTIANLKNGPKSTNLKFYFASILQTVLYYNATIYQKVFETMYNISQNTWGESLIIVFLGKYFLALLPILCLVNTFVFVGAYFYFIINFFYTEKKEGGYTTWTYDSDNFSWFWYIVYIFIAFCLIFIPFSLGSILGAVICLYLLILPAYVTGTVKGSDGINNNYNFGKFLTDTFKYKKHIIMIVFTLYILYDAYKTWGTVALVYGLLSVCIILIMPSFRSSIYGIYEPKPNDHSTVGLAETVLLERKKTEEGKVEMTSTGEIIKKSDGAENQEEGDDEYPEHEEEAEAGEVNQVAEAGADNSGADNSGAEAGAGAEIKVGGRRRKNVKPIKEVKPNKEAKSLKVKKTNKKSRKEINKKLK